MSDWRRASAAEWLSLWFSNADLPARCLVREFEGIGCHHWPIIKLNELQPEQPGQTLLVPHRSSSETSPCATSQTPGRQSQTGIARRPAARSRGWCINTRLSRRKQGTGRERGEDDPSPCRESRTCSAHTPSLDYDAQQKQRKFCER